MRLKSKNLPTKILVHLVLAFGYFSITGLLPKWLEHLAAANWKEAISSDGVPFLLLSFGLLLLNGLVPHIYKSRLVHLRWKDPLPGSRAFSGLMTSDSRIDFAGLEAKHGVPPGAGAEQNRHFYKIYKTVETDEQVRGSHQTYLLFRDLALETCILTIIGSLLAFGFKAGLVAALSVLAAGAIVTLVLIVVARNYAHRFVGNVLSRAS